MSTLNTRSDLKRLLQFAKIKPKIPSKLPNKVNIKTNEQKNCPNSTSPESFRCEVLTGKSDTAKPVQVINCINETPKKNILVTDESIQLQNDSEINSKNKKFTAQKSSNVSVVSLGKVQNSKTKRQQLNIPLSKNMNNERFNKTLNLQDLIYYNPVANPIIKKKKVKKDEEDNPNDDLLPIKSDKKSSIPNICITPCLKLDASGKIIIDQETLTLNETDIEEMQEKLARSQAIEESGIQTYNQKNRTKPKRWSKNETIKFYKCLMELGTDFSLIQQYFPDWTRAQLKRKYKFEEKNNSQLINDAAFPNKNLSDKICVENILQDEPKSADDTNVHANSKIYKQKNHKKRSNDVKQSDYRRMNTFGYMENEKKKKSTLSLCRVTAGNLKDKFLALKRIDVKSNYKTKSKTKTPCYGRNLFHC